MWICTMMMMSIMFMVVMPIMFVVVSVCYGICFLTAYFLTGT